MESQSWPLARALSEKTVLFSYLLDMVARGRADLAAIVSIGPIIEDTGCSLARFMMFVVSLSSCHQ